MTNVDLEPFTLHAPLEELRQAIRTDIQARLGAIGIGFEELYDQYGIDSPEYVARTKTEDDDLFKLTHKPYLYYDNFDIYATKAGESVGIRDADFHGSRVVDFEYRDTRPVASGRMKGQTRYFLAKDSVFTDANGVLLPRQAERPDQDLGYSRGLYVERKRLGVPDGPTAYRHDTLRGEKGMKERQAIGKKIARLLDGIDPTVNARLVGKTRYHGGIEYVDINPETVRELSMRAS